jgi:hypothetical protein
MHNTTSELSIHEKEAFVLCALPAMAQHTLRFLCSVIGVSDSKTGRHYGSALRCMLNGRRAILTALHVIEAAKEEPLVSQSRRTTANRPMPSTAQSISIESPTCAGRLDENWASERIDRSPAGDRLSVPSWISGKVIQRTC